MTGVIWTTVHDKNVVAPLLSMGKMDAKATKKAVRQ